MLNVLPSADAVGWTYRLCNIQMAMKSLFRYDKVPLHLLTLTLLFHTNYS